VRFILKDDIKRQLEQGNVVLLSNMGEQGGVGGCGWHMTLACAHTHMRSLAPLFSFKVPAYSLFSCWLRRWFGCTHARPHADVHTPARLAHPTPPCA
jgi:hypothetical protein